MGERGVDVGGQRLCTKRVLGLVSNMLRCGLKYRKLRLKGLQMEMIVGEWGGGQRPCTKHVLGLVSNMLRCGVKYSGN